MARDLDVVVFGATGDTGTVGCCCYYFLGKRLGISSWAPAARNLDKLKAEVLDRLAGSPPGPDGLAPAEPIWADSSDHASLVSMCGRAKCVLACAGPYSEYGEGVVRACVETGAHYVDISGEVPWMGAMLNKYGEEAKARAVTVVNLAGYDAVPPDLAAWLAAKALEKAGERLTRFDSFVSAGGAAPPPSGTVNTLVLAMDGKASAHGAPDAPAGGGYVPEEEAGAFRESMRWAMVPGYSGPGGQFCLPHFMAPINTVAVHHTAAREGYGGLVYRERLGGLPNGPLSLFGLIPMVVGTGAMLPLAVLRNLPGASSAVLWAADRLKASLNGGFRARVFGGFRSTGLTKLEGFGVSASGRHKVRVDMESEYDGGLGFTMLSACTVAASVVNRAPGAGTYGFATSVVALGGEELATALRNAGMKIEVRMVNGDSSL